MSIETKIEWADHTLNLWWGCYPVSPGCINCYAEVMDNRYGGGHWATIGPRKFKAEKSWMSDLHKAQRLAVKAGKRQSVFVMSMGDIFEKPMPLRKQIGFGESVRYEDMGMTTGDVRDKFFSVVRDFPELVFLLLTKRPGNINKYVPEGWKTDCPPNVWFGCSVTNQEEWDMNIPKLIDAPGSCNKFVSMEPLLGPVVLSDLPCCPDCGSIDIDFNDDCNNCGADFMFKVIPINWIIVGGESGHNARPMNPEWVKSIADECEVTPFMFKQWGKWMPSGDTDLGGNPVMVKASGAKHHDRKIGGMEYNGIPEWGIINS